MAPWLVCGLWCVVGVRLVRALDAGGGVAASVVGAAGVGIVVWAVWVVLGRVGMGAVQVWLECRGVEWGWVVSPPALVGHGRGLGVGLVRCCEPRHWEGLVPRRRKRSLRLNLGVEGEDDELE